LKNKNKIKIKGGIQGQVSERRTAGAADDAGRYGWG
jgi:hypothetical protein